MNRHCRTIALRMAILGLLSGTASADEVTDRFTFNAALSSEYVFRFISQTQERAAVSAGIDWESGTGFHLGAWGSNVDFGDDARLEIDFYGGYRFTVGEGVVLDFGFINYEYFNDLHNDNIVEGYASISRGPASLTIYPDLRDHDYYWVEGDYSRQFGPILASLTLGALLPDEGDGYQGWGLGASYGPGEITYSLTAYGTNNDGRVAFGKLADTRVVLSVAAEF